MLVLAAPMVELMVSDSPEPAAVAARLFHDTLARHAAHVVSVPEFNDWGDAIDLMEAHSQNDTIAPRPNSTQPWRQRTLRCPPFPWLASPLGGVRSVNCTAGNETRLLKSTGSAAIVGVYRWYVKRALMERRLLGRYDWFIHTRTDSFMLCQLRLPSSVLLQQVIREERALALIPDGEGWGGVSERFLVASRSAILPAMTTLELWVAGRELFGNPEMQLRASLRTACVGVLSIPRSTFVVQLISNGSKLPKQSHSDAAGPRSSSPGTSKAAFEVERSNWGGCMHAAFHEDAWRFGMPDAMVRRRSPVPLQMRKLYLCPKYSGAWWLTERTCNSSNGQV
jgi:hypothetical protein